MMNDYGIVDFFRKYALFFILFSALAVIYAIILSVRGK